MKRILAFFALVFFATAAQAAHMTEDQKISALLDSFTASHVTLVRNGEEHDGAWAKQHFEDKLKEVKGVKTAKDFISKVASKSRESGKPYMVKMEDGKTETSAKWLHHQLAELEKADKK